MGNPTQYLNSVLFCMVKITGMTIFRLKMHQKRLVAGLPRIGELKENVLPICVIDMLMPLA